MEQTHGAIGSGLCSWFYGKTWIFGPEVMTLDESNTVGTVIVCLPPVPCFASEGPYNTVGEHCVKLYKLCPR